VKQDKIRSIGLIERLLEEAGVSRIVLHQQYVEAFS
jgi:hypothetical protein